MRHGLVDRLVTVEAFWRATHHNNSLRGTSN